MEFDSQEAAYNLYNANRRKVGFSIRKERHYKNKKTNEVTSRIFACSKEGFQLQEFYAVQSDNEEQITNILWADAKLVSDYGHFGDVSFDTTYKTNRAGRPFAVFAGLNHHRECAHMLVKHNVQGKTLEWLKGIKKLRKKWTKAYVKMAWSARMTTTGIGESFDARLKEYLQSDYNVVQFFMHFERVLNDQRGKEYQAEYNLCYKNARVKVAAMKVKQAGDTYTKAIFEDFQEQYGEVPAIID